MSIYHHTLHQYWQHVKKFRTSFFIMLIAVPCSAVLISTALPYSFSQVIGSLSNHDTAASYQWLTVAVIAGLIGCALNLIGFQTMARHESKVISENRNATFSKLIQKDAGFFINEKIGSLTSHYIDYVRNETVLQDLFIIRTLSFILTVGSGMIIIAGQSLLVVCLVALLISILVIQIQWSVKKRTPHRKERHAIRASIHGIVADALTNNLIVKTFSGEKREKNELEKLGKKFNHVYMKDIGFLAAEGSTRVFIMTVAQLTTIGVCLHLLSTGSITIATMIFVVSYLQFIGSQIFTLGDLLNGYEQALTEAEPLTKILIKQNRVVDQKNAIEVNDLRPSIEFSDVSYRYDDNDEDVLRGISINIPAGQKVGLVGHSGAGKTTITHLLLRFADVVTGSIQIGGYDIRSLSQDNLRAQIAFVPQEPFLFHRSLRDNIAYGKPNASDSEIYEAAKKANALEFIDTLPQKLGTVVGERGVKLSGGQRQRIAIARAILKDAPILVLDEATSALDSESEHLIQKALQQLMKGRTSIVIAHRLSTIAKLDRIIVLENGQVSEDGTHSELLTQKGIYSKLWAHQSGGFIEE